MSYHHYTTEGIVLKREDRGENDAVYVVLTQDLGLIAVQATGIRLLKSKLRTVLQPRNIVSITVVRGKAAWRVTTCQLIETINDSLTPAVPRLYKLLRQFVVFDEIVPEVFVCYKNFLTIDTTTATNLRCVRTAEILTTARLLYILGMLDNLGIKEIENQIVFSVDFCESKHALAETLLKHINKRLSETLL